MNMRSSLAPRHYILDATGEPVPCDLMTWATWLETSDDARRVAFDTIDGVDVSTVFLGLDHRFGSGPPVLFETLVFGGLHDGAGDRYCTRAEALAGHARFVQQVKGG